MAHPPAVEYREDGAPSENELRLQYAVRIVIKGTPDECPDLPGQRQCESTSLSVADGCRAAGA